MRTPVPGGRTGVGGTISANPRLRQSRECRRSGLQYRPRQRAHSPHASRVAGASVAAEGRDICEQDFVLWLSRVAKGGEGGAARNYVGDGNVVSGEGPHGLGRGRLCGEQGRGFGGG